MRRLTPPFSPHYFPRQGAPRAVCGRLRGGLDSGMEETNRPRYAFKIGQQVYRRHGGTQRTGPYMIVGMVREGDDRPFLYRLSGPAGEHLAPESELKLALQPRAPE